MLENLAPLSEDALDIPYQTALTKATQMLKSPYTVWESVGVHEKHRLFSFIFEEKLAFSKSEGYQTAKSSVATRLFEEIVAENPLDVDLVRIQWNTILRELYDWHQVITSETIKFYSNQPA